MAYDFMENFDKNNKRFKDEISKYIDENIRREGHIVLGETPPVLGLAGADTKLPLVIPCEQINHIIDKHYKKSNNYGLLEKEDTLKLYESIINPICLISGSEKDTCVVITDFKNKNGINIQVPVFFNIDQDEIKVSTIATQYPNRTLYEYIIKEILKHNLIAHHNKKLEDLLRPIGLLLPVGHISSSSKDSLAQNNHNVNKKLENLLHSIGLLLPKENTNISSKYILPQIKDLVNSYDDSIIHNLDNVKYCKINDLENRYFKFNTDNKFFKPTFRANYLELNNACKELGWGDALQYFTEGEKLSKVRDGEYLWKIEMFKYDKDRKQLQNKLIEHKTKEIEEKLKEIKNMLNVKEVIEYNIKSYLQGNSYKDAITLDQKIVNQYESLEKHFKNDIKEQKGVGYHAAKAAALGLFMDDPTIESKFYPDYKGDVFEKYCKDCSVVFDDMYKQSKENITKIRKEIKNYIEGLKEVKGGGNIQQAQKIIEAYYETTTFYEAPENIKEVEEHIKNRLKNLFERFKDDKMILGLNTTEKENSHWNEYYKRDFEKYDKLLDATYCIIWTASHQSKVEYKKNANPESTIYDQVIEESANADIHSTLEEDAKKAVAEKEVTEQAKETEKEEKGNVIDEKDNSGRE